MLVVAEARTAILRVSVVAATDIALIIGAMRTHYRWMRVILAVAAVPASLAFLYGVWVISLILQYGPR
jgi:hypothetical protein